jgi:hypothetical protein
MKKILYFILIISMTGVSSCYDGDNIYKEFTVPDGIVYPQKVESLKACPGLYRIQLEWLKPIDTQVVKARIYWNNYTDSLDVTIPANQEKITQLIENLRETTYTFYVKTYDADGNVSIPVEVSSKAYGAAYQASLLPRPLLGLSAFVDRAELSWGVIDQTAVRFVLKYRSSSGELHELLVPLDEEKTILRDYQLGSDFTMETYYLPTPTAIDEFVATDEQKFPEEAVLEKLPKNTWTNAQLPTDSWFPADGNFNMWGLEHLWGGQEAPTTSNWDCFASDGISPFPQHFTIDLGYHAIISRMQLWPWIEIYAGMFPRIFELWGSDNPPADGSWDNWTLLGKWEVFKPSGYEADGAVGSVTAEDTEYFNYNQTYELAPSAEIPDPYRKVRYIRFKTVNSFASYINGAPAGYVCINEMALWGTVINE